MSSLYIHSNGERSGTIAECWVVTALAEGRLSPTVLGTSYGDQQWRSPHSFKFFD